MISTSMPLREPSLLLGLPEDFTACAINIVNQNRDLVNAMDHTGEMDNYIYSAILKTAFMKRKSLAEASLSSPDASVQRSAELDLTALRREELTSDVFYRAVLPLVVKVVCGEPILRLHVEEASRIVLHLADVKRKHRAVSITELIVKKCLPRMEFS